MRTGWMDDGGRERETRVRLDGFFIYLFDFLFDLIRVLKTVHESNLLLYYIPSVPYLVSSSDASGR